MKEDSATKPRAFTGTFEVWVKPLFRKARPTITKACWCAEDMADFLRFVKRDMDSRYKRWRIIRVDEEPVRDSRNEIGEA